MINIDRSPVASGVVDDDALMRGKGLGTAIRQHVSVP
jgi:hypothetical protein